MRAILGVWCLLFQGACIVSPGDTVQVTFCVGVPSSATYAAGSDFSPWDEYGQFHLGTFPKYVRVAVEHQDYELVNATWPDPKAGMGSGEGAEGEVDVTLEAPAGAARRVQVLGFVTDLDWVLVYGGGTVVDLVAGQDADLTVATTRLETGRIDMTVRCQQGNAGYWVPDRVMLWDARAAVLFPPHTLKQVSPTGALGVEIESVPVERQFWARVVLRHMVTGAETSVEARNFFGVEQPDEMQAVNIIVLCPEG